MFEAALAGEISYGQNMSVPRVAQLPFIFKNNESKISF